MIICISGMPCSGKDEFSKVLAAKGFKVLRMRDIIKEMMDDAGVSIDRESMRTFSTSLRKKYGDDIVARLMAKRIKAARMSKGIAICGIRGEPEVLALKKLLDDSFLSVWMETRADIRFKRMMKRKRKDDPMDLKGFRKRESIEKGWGTESVRKHADVIISNEGSLADLRKSALLLISRLNTNA